MMSQTALSGQKARGLYAAIQLWSKGQNDHLFGDIR
jgi:hypothetical protein